MSLLHDAGLYLSSHEQSKLTSASGRSPYHPEKARSFFRVQELRQRLHGLLDARCAAHGPLLDASSSKPAFFRAAFGFTELATPQRVKTAFESLGLPLTAEDLRDVLAHHGVGNEGGKVDVEALLSDVLGEIPVRPKPEEPAEPAVEDQAPPADELTPEIPLEPPLQKRETIETETALIDEWMAGVHADRLLDDDERMKEAAAAAEAPPPPPEVQADGAEVWRLDGADEPYTPEAPYTPPGALPPPGLSVDEAIAWYQSAPPPAPYATFAVPALPSRRGASPPPRPATAAPAGRDSTSLGSRVAADAMRWRRPGTAAASMLQHGHLVDTVAAADPSAPRPQTAAGKAPYGLDAVPDGAVSWHGIPPCRPATAEPTTAAARRRRAPLAPPYATAPADEVENVPPKTAASPSDVLRLAAAAGSRIRLDDEHPSMMPWASSWMDQSKRPSSRRVRALPRGSQIPWG